MGEHMGAVVQVKVAPRVHARLQHCPAGAHRTVSAMSEVTPDRRRDSGPQPSLSSTTTSRLNPSTTHSLAHRIYLLDGVRTRVCDARRIGKIMAHRLTGISA